MCTTDYRPYLHAYDTRVEDQAHDYILCIVAKAVASVLDVTNAIWDARLLLAPNITVSFTCSPNHAQRFSLPNTMTLLRGKPSIILHIILPHFMLPINPMLEAWGGVSLRLFAIRLSSSVVRR